MAFYSDQLQKLIPKDIFKHQSPILILLFYTAAIIYLISFSKKQSSYFNQAYYLHSSFLFFSFFSFFFFWSTRGIFWKILMLKSFNRKLNSKKFGCFSWIAKIKSATFKGKSKVSSAKNHFLRWLNRKNKFHKNFLRLNCNNHQFRVLMICNKNRTVSKLGRRII